jgi:hypothetical protein
MPSLITEFAKDGIAYKVARQDANVARLECLLGGVQQHVNKSTETPPGRSKNKKGRFPLLGPLL